jgi:hypothetical protein
VASALFEDDERHAIGDQRRAGMPQCVERDLP